MMTHSTTKDIAAIIVNRNQAELSNALAQQMKEMQGVSIDVYVVEMGSDEGKFSNYASYWYADPRFSGKCLGHNIGLAYVKGCGQYKYFWFLMNDLVFDDQEAAHKMVTVMEAEQRMGILSPTELESVNKFPCSAPITDSICHKVSTCDYLGLFMRKECLDEVGFLNPGFKYSWGAIHELSYRMYQKGWFIAYCDIVQMKHLGGTTYGKVKGTVSREEYKRRARLWAANYFREIYGPDWDVKFSKHLPDDISINTYTYSKIRWEKELSHHTANKEIFSKVFQFLIPPRLMKKLKHASKFFQNKRQ